VAVRETYSRGSWQLANCQALLLKLHVFHICILKIHLFKFSLLYDGMKGACTLELHSNMFIHYLRVELNLTYYEYCIRLMFICCKGLIAKLLIIFFAVLLVIEG